jgi:glycosyltransferase involved in cell wall biosynthesis
MSVYNGARDVPTAVRSILGQTFRDFELIAINDGSFKDDTRTVLDSLARDSADPRLRVVHLDKNVGLAAALNLGIGLAQGRYIFRQDHDDISFPTRLEKQIAFLERNPNCALLGTAAEIWVGDAPSGRVHDRNGQCRAAGRPFVSSHLSIHRDAAGHDRPRQSLHTLLPASHRRISGSGHA